MTAELPLASELSVALARMSGLLLSQETVSSALRLVTSLAAETIPRSVGAGVSLFDDRRRRSSAAVSSAEVGRADALQYEMDEGPCLASWEDRIVIRVDDTATDPRWPQWCPAAAALGVRSSLSSPLIASESGLGAIKVYSDRPGAYDERSEHLLALCAAQASILLANMQPMRRRSNCWRI